MTDLEVAYLSKSRCIVSGYKGYIGSTLIKSLDENIIITYLSKIDGKTIDTVVHLAARVSSDFSTISNNIQLDMLIIDYCKKNNCQLIYASTNNVYPYAKDCKHSISFNKGDLYGASKILTEQILEQVSDIKYVNLRIGDVFGKNQKHGNFFKSIQSSIEDKKEIMLYGKGLKVRNYIYVYDLVNVIRFFIENSFIENKNYNIAYSIPVNIEQIVKYISEKCNLSICKVEYDIGKEMVDFRTLEPTIIEGFSYKFDMWSALDDFIKQIKEDSSE